MKLRGLRAQLCLWHAALMALTLLALAGFTYVLLVKFLHSRADANLLKFADTTARQIATFRYLREGGPAVQQSQSGDSPNASRPGYLSNDQRTWGRYIQVIDPQGRPREWSDGLSTNKLPVSPDCLRRGMQGLTTFETVPGLGEHPVRIVTVPVRMGQRTPLLVQAATSLEGVEAALQRAGWILLVLTPGVLLVSLVGGWLLVGRALRRVDTLTRTAVEIQSTNLQRRIHHAGPDDEIGRLAQAFDQMIARLDRSFQQVRQFSADASHELKTPLTAIRGEAEVALLGELPADEYRRTIRSILESAERMSEVVESLLLLARADSGQNLVQRDPVELGELLLRAVESVEVLAARHEVTVVVDEVDDLIVSGDSLWLNQVTVNLLSNGIKYTSPGGTVTASLVREDGMAVLSVRDTGIGIPDEHLARIFDRFYRVDSGRSRAAGGTGLGLSITRWAVEAHDGEIGVESAVGQGSVFRVKLPLAEVASEAEPAAVG